MKTILLAILDADQSYNRSASRYLYKTHPDLWAQIVAHTSFLPNTALPKQRVWHIINEIGAIPLCPIEGVPLRWNENQYFGTSSRRAKQLLKHQNGDYAAGHSNISNEKRRIGNLLAVKHGRGYRDKSTYTDADRIKSKNTCLIKYGVENGSQTKESRNKIYQSNLDRGCTPRDQRSLRRLYYDAVWGFTEQSWKQDFDKINPTRINRTINALDHIYSIQQGFRDNIPPYIIGHWSNLRVISLSDNSKKGMNCAKTQNELFEDFFNQSS